MIINLAKHAELYKSIILPSHFLILCVPSALPKPITFLGPG